jgi:hypothetical protein
LALPLFPDPWEEGYLAYVKLSQKAEKTGFSISTKNAELSFEIVSMDIVKDFLERTFSCLVNLPQKAPRRNVLPRVTAR